MAGDFSRRRRAVIRDQLALQLRLAENGANPTDLQLGEGPGLLQQPSGAVFNDELIADSGSDLSLPDNGQTADDSLMSDFLYFNENCNKSLHESADIAIVSCDDSTADVRATENCFNITCNVTERSQMSQDRTCMLRGSQSHSGLHQNSPAFPCSSSNHISGNGNCFLQRRSDKKELKSKSFTSLGQSYMESDQSSPKKDKECPEIPQTRRLNSSQHDASTKDWREAFRNKSWYLINNKTCHLDRVFHGDTTFSQQIPIYLNIIQYMDIIISAIELRSSWKSHFCQQRHKQNVQTLKKCYLTYSEVCHNLSSHLECVSADDGNVLVRKRPLHGSLCKSSVESLPDRDQEDKLRRQGVLSQSPATIIECPRIFRHSIEKSTHSSVDRQLKSNCERYCSSYHGRCRRGSMKRLTGEPDVKEVCNSDEDSHNQISPQTTQSRAAVSQYESGSDDISSNHTGGYTCSRSSPKRYISSNSSCNARLLYGCHTHYYRGTRRPTCNDRQQYYQQYRRPQHLSVINGRYGHGQSKAETLRVHRNRESTWCHDARHATERWLQRSHDGLNKSHWGSRYSRGIELHSPGLASSERRSKKRRILKNKYLYGREGDLVDRACKDRQSLPRSEGSDSSSRGSRQGHSPEVKSRQRKDNLSRGQFEISNCFPESSHQTDGSTCSVTELAKIGSDLREKTVSRSQSFRKNCILKSNKKSSFSVGPNNLRQTPLDDVPKLIPNSSKYVTGTVSCRRQLHPTDIPLSGSPPPGSDPIIKRQKTSVNQTPDESHQTKKADNRQSSVRTRDVTIPKIAQLCSRKNIEQKMSGIALSTLNITPPTNCAHNSHVL